MVLFTVRGTWLIVAGVLVTVGMVLLIAR